MTPSAPKENYILLSTHEKILYGKNFDIKKKYLEQITAIEDNYRRKSEEAITSEISKQMQLYQKNLKAFEDTSRKHLERSRGLEIESEKACDIKGRVEIELKEVKGFLDEKKNKVEELEIRIQELNILVNGFGGEKLELIKRINQFETKDKISEITGRNNETLKENAEKVWKVREAEAEKIKNYNFELIETNCKLNREVAGLEKCRDEKISELGAAKKLAERNAAGLRSEIDVLKTQVKSEEASQHKLLTKITELQTELDCSNEAVASLKEDIRKFEDQKISLRREITEMSYNVKRKDALEDELSQSHKDLLELEDKFSEKNKEIEAIKNSKTRYKKTMTKLFGALAMNLKDVAKEVKQLKTTVKQQKTFFKDYFTEKCNGVVEEIEFDLRRLFSSFQGKAKVQFTNLTKSKDSIIGGLEKNVYTLKKRAQESEATKNEFAVQRDNWFSEREELSIKIGEWEEAYGSIEYELSAKIEDQDVQLGA